MEEGKKKQKQWRSHLTMWKGWKTLSTGSLVPPSFRGYIAALKVDWPVIYYFLKDTIYDYKWSITCVYLAHLIKSDISGNKNKTFKKEWLRETIAFPVVWYVNNIRNLLKPCFILIGFWIHSFSDCAFITFIYHCLLPLWGYLLSLKKGLGGN